MKKRRCLAILVAAVLAGSAQARNIGVYVDAAKLHARAIQQGAVPSTLSILLGSESAPADGKLIKEVMVVGKAYHAVNTPDRLGSPKLLSDEEACELAVLDALRSLAGEAGAGKLVAGNLVSVWRGKRYNHATQFECRAGTGSVGIGLQGKLYRLE